MASSSLLETLIIEFDAALRSLAPPSQRFSERLSPGASQENISPLSETERKRVAGLMRVNHAGEICAQALYQGQALTADREDIRYHMLKAAQEEGDHLAWCEERLQQLKAGPSLLNPCWYLASFLLGAFAGRIGDHWSLGFVAETERQVSAHLNSHLKQLPQGDNKTRAILEQMYEDEQQHASQAIDAGGRELPFFLKSLMQGASKVMTNLSYYI